MALCAGYVAVQAEMEVLVLRLDASSESKPQEESTDAKKGFHNNKTNKICLKNEFFLVHNPKINIGNDVLN